MTENDRSTAGVCDPDFEEVQRALTIEMIATPRKDFVTCSPRESIADAHKRASADDRGFDHLPVEDNRVIIGLHRVREPTSSSTDGLVRDHMDSCGISEANESIRDYLHQEPGPRLVVQSAGCHQRVRGLVTPADTSRPAAQAALACLIFEFEIWLVDRINERWPKDAWMSRLCRKHKDDVERRYKRAVEEKRDIGRLLETTLPQKMAIFGLSTGCPDFKLVRDIRNTVFHVKDVAREPQHLATPDVPFRGVQALKRVRKEIANLPSS